MPPTASQAQKASLWWSRTALENPDTAVRKLDGKRAKIIRVFCLISHFAMVRWRTLTAVQNRTSQEVPDDPDTTISNGAAMANEATKKDLADLEKKLNTKLQALVDSTNTAFEKETATINKTIEEHNKAIELYNAAILDLRKKIGELTTVVNQHAKVINDMNK